MLENKAVLSGIVVAALVMSSVFMLGSGETPVVQAQGLRTFTSKGELDSYVGKGLNSPVYRGPLLMEKGAVDQAAGPASAEYSNTNIQVAGVDEADIVKTDGRYIYIASENKFLIVNAYPADQMKIVSKSSVEGRISGLFIGQDRLVIFEDGSYIMREPPIGLIEPAIRPGGIIAPYVTGFHIKVYDTSLKQSPKLVRDISMNGTYVNSRMIDNWVYVVASQPAVIYTNTKYEVIVPTISSEGKTEKVPVNQIH